MSISGSFDIFTAYSCEHPLTGEKSALLQCDQGFVIRVNSAIYGKLTKDQCVHSGQQNVACGSTADHTTNVKAKCDGEESCTYHGNNKVAGDPCPTVQKHTVIEYSCVKN